MDKAFSVPEIAEREKNFFNGELPSTIEGKSYYIDLQLLADNVIADYINRMNDETYSKAEILRTVFAYVYDFVMDRNKEYRILDNNEDVFEACFFMSLCMFLYDTRRIKGMSLRKFLYEHSPRGFNIKGSPNYFDFESRSRKFCNSNSDAPDVSSDFILGEEATLRQYRKRLLEKRPVYHDSSEWSAIRKVLEHEWDLYFVLDEADDEIRDTAKRIRNLYNDIYRVLESEIDEGYVEKLDNAGKKFCSKLEKIQYERFLNLGKFFLAHIEKDKTCYGLNLYRFEKELKLYRITSDVNRLLACDDEVESERITDLAIRMNDITFPKLYEYFAGLPNVRHTQFYADMFWMFMDEVVQSSRLVIDKYVEDGIWGEDWEQLFLETTNELATTVLYNPSEINYSVTPDSQREFLIYLLEAVDRRLKSEEVYLSKFMSQSKLDDEK